MGSSEFAEEVFKLNRFNMNARKLKSSGFMEWFARNTLSIDFLIAKDSPRESFVPDSHFEEFLSIFRKCIKDKTCSVAEVAKAYTAMGIDQDAKERFHDFKEGLYRCLDARPFKGIAKLEAGMRNLTVLGLMDVFLYGEFLQDHPQKSAMFRKISENVHIREFYWFEFYTHVYKSALILFHIMMLNENVLKGFGET